MTIGEAIQILESRTGYRIVADDCDADTVIEAIQIVCEAVKEQ